MVSLMFWTSSECGALVNCHYSQVHTDLLLVPIYRPNYIQVSIKKISKIRQYKNVNMNIQRIWLFNFDELTDGWLVGCLGFMAYQLF